MNDIGQIELLKKCVEFYANENNYLSRNGMSQIDHDRGGTARGILEIIKKTEKEMQDVSIVIKEIQQNFDNIE